MIELRLGNQQRHSITAVLLSAVVVIFGLVLVDVLSNSEPEPFGGQTRAVDTSSTSVDLGVSESNDDLTAGVARSNARFTLNPDVTVIGSESTTSTTAPRKTTTSAVAASASPATTNSTTLGSSTSAPTTSSTEPPETSASSGTSSTTETTTVDPRPKPSTTVVDDETTTTKKCRGNRPDCRKP